MDKQKVLTELAMRRDTLALKLKQAKKQDDVAFVRHLEDQIRRSNKLIRYAEELME